MGELIELLKKVESETDPVQIGELMEQAASLATKTLIVGNKVPNNLIEKMAEYGYEVYPGDRDSFGWLTGCLKTRRGVIVFG